MSRKRIIIGSKRRLAMLLGGLAVSLPLAGSVARAHHPDRENQAVHQRVDVIGPVGNRLAPGYRRTYNRPSYIEGKIAYHIAPSSQEAMAWHRAVHRDLYSESKRCKRYTDLYFYPKPWEALLTGPRSSQGIGADETVIDSVPTIDSGNVEEIEDALNLQPPGSDDLGSSPSDRGSRFAAPRFQNGKQQRTEPELPLLDLNDYSAIQRSGGVSNPSTDTFGVESQFGLASSEEEIAQDRLAADPQIAAPKIAAPKIMVDEPEMVVAATGNQSKAKKSARTLNPLSLLTKPIYLRFSPAEN
ncbi:hypothetical protein LOC67_12600 [Stieleria sp. JC731]|uniref:hypothetical protein n=1 Tax=Pirellulaceae TaxID=2691357 RepID=UPI001E44AED0|nr:hypothetical protein [Stieleria sp. JC731]MCC9601387.1 hypothetical protein [Stieleria sp. JC731]